MTDIPRTPSDEEGLSPPFLPLSSSFKPEEVLMSLHREEPRKKVLVFGSGNFGSCLADHLANVGHFVSLYSRSLETVESINETHKNPKYLSDHVFPDNLKAVGPEVPEFDVVATADVLVFAIPTQSMRALLELLDLKRLGSPPVLVFVNKGIELGSNKLPFQVIEDTCGGDIAKVATFLSGPSFAKEIVNVNNDPIGVELAGALKNIYAIASGVANGLGYQANTRAGLVTRSLAEMTRIGVVMGADPLTFLSLAGVGDLFLTCSSEKSRNFSVGDRLGRGEELDHILDTLGSVAEGVDTAKSAFELIQEKGVSAPIIEHVYRLLWCGESARDLANALMTLPMMEELNLDTSPSSPLSDTERYYDSPPL